MATKQTGLPASLATGGIDSQTLSESRIRQQMADCARALHARGWVAYHEGNVTARISADRILATPTAVSKAVVTSDALIAVDLAGRVTSGRGKPFSELGLHLAVYRARPDVSAVVHAHPPTATGLAIAGRALDRPLMPEAIVALGSVIPLVPVTAPGAAAAVALEPFVSAYDAVLLANHGVVTWGRDVEMAALRMELVEAMAERLWVAEQLGGARELPREVVEACLEARRNAGLARPGVPTVASSDLVAMIRQEVKQVLRR